MILSEPLIDQLARRLQTSRQKIERELAVLVRLISEQAKRDGRIRVPHLGIFEHRDGLLHFEPTDSLAEAVNYRYQGMGKIVVPPSATAVSDASPTPHYPQQEATVQAAQQAATKPVADEISDTSRPPNPSDLSSTPAGSERTAPRKKSAARPVLFALLLLFVAAAAVFFLVYDGSFLQVKQAIGRISQPGDVNDSNAQPLPPATGESTTHPGNPADNADSLFGSRINLDEATTGWTIVAASETDSTAAYTYADRLRLQLDSLRLPIGVLVSDVDGIIRYRVSLGHFESEVKADSAILRLSNALPADAWALSLAPD